MKYFLNYVNSKTEKINEILGRLFSTQKVEIIDLEFENNNIEGENQKVEISSKLLFFCI